MADQIVRVLDADTQQIVTIPAIELAPGMIRIRMNPDNVAETGCFGRLDLLPRPLPVDEGIEGDGESAAPLPARG